ncbi:DUF4113 domain-containing protein [Sodalis sp. RH14]|uniref:DUF4113 domain-containing protein n=2 Tax=unclassified Sodalis (in: enterobacteria) TaxID=2636512 RepID=UPI0016544D61
MVMYTNQSKWTKVACMQGSFEEETLFVSTDIGSRSLVETFWKMRCEILSPAYTTSWKELPLAVIR